MNQKLVKRYHYYFISCGKSLGFIEFYCVRVIHNLFPVVYCTLFAPCGRNLIVNKLFFFKFFFYSILFFENIVLMYLFCLWRLHFLLFLVNNKSYRSTLNILMKLPMYFLKICRYLSSTDFTFVVSL